MDKQLSQLSYTLSVFILLAAPKGYADSPKVDPCLLEHPFNVEAQDKCRAALPDKPKKPPLPKPKPKKPASSSVQSGYFGAGKWTITRSTDDLTGAQTVSAVLKAKSGRSKWGDPQQLVLRCRGKKTYVYVNWNEFITTRSPYVSYSFDGGKVYNDFWLISSDYTATFLSGSLFGGKQKKFFKKLTSARQFVIRTTPHGENPRTAVFDLSQLGSLQGHAPECGWY